MHIYVAMQSPPRPPPVPLGPPGPPRGDMSLGPGPLVLNPKVSPARMYREFLNRRVDVDAPESHIQLIF